MEPKHFKLACACCGYRTLEAPAASGGGGGTWAICPVCFWEDAPEWVEDGPRRCGSNGVGLREAQRNFLKFGAAEEVYREAVRPAREDEAREEGWEPLDGLAEREARASLAEIEAAFRGVTREGGVSLHETIAIDSYGAEDPGRMRALDTDRRWEDVRDEDLAEVAVATYFFDDIGWRYHLPAYMRWWLVGDAAANGSMAADHFLHALRITPNAEGVIHESERGRVELLDAAQRRCVARFLRWIERFAMDPIARETAHKALLRLWSRFE